ncbi:MAG: nucleotidyltransferase family protein [Gammaproteobacteria bacterium]|nr:nucleotidyltransferase family protein [Gammaproteobacteria bacterium]
MIELSVVIFAGGASRRLGVTKQMINYHGVTLIAHACRRALQLSNNVTVITGANHHSVEAEAHKFKVDVVYNPKWEEGLANSVSLAIKHEFNAKHVLLMNCDQPLIPLDHYQALVEKSKIEADKIIATECDDVYQLPAVFPNRLFYELTTLQEDDSPDSVIQAHLAEVSSITHENAAFTVDTVDDMRRLKEF